MMNLRRLTLLHFPSMRSSCLLKRPYPQSFSYSRSSRQKMMEEESKIQVDLFHHLSRVWSSIPLSLIQAQFLPQQKPVVAVFVVVEPPPLPPPFLTDVSLLLPSLLHAQLGL